MIKAIIMENQEAVRKNLIYIIEGDCGIKVVGCAEDVREAFVLCEQTDPDLVLMDLFMPDCDGVEAVKIIKQKRPAIKILVLVSFWNEEKIVGALKNDADGCLLKDVQRERLTAGIKSAVNGLKVIDKAIYKLISNTFNYDNTFGTNYLLRDTNRNELTERQLTILGLLAEGLKEGAVAEEIGLSVNTIKYHKKQIFEKLDAVCTNEALVKATRLNLIISRTNEISYAC